MVIDGEVIQQAVPRTEVLDTVGAGDAFIAGAVHGLLHDWPPAKALTLANRVASLVVARIGAMPDVAAEYAQLLASLGGRA